MVTSIKERIFCPDCGKSVKNLKLHQRFCGTRDSPDKNAELKIYRDVIRILVPRFPQNKLDVQSLEELKRFVFEISQEAQSELFRKYWDLSP